jgi:RimJ/RimL family protein N-acetyltransferase
MSNGTFSLEKFVRLSLIYQLKQDWTQSLVCKDPQLTWIQADVESTCRLFSRDSRQKKAFLGFLEAGHIGLYISDGDSWITYAWMSTPMSYGPPHFPKHIQAMDVYWIFSCRTKENYQGQGYYKMALEIIIRRAIDENPAISVFIDTSISNIPSRRAIMRVGFGEKGMAIIFRIPKLNLIWGRWFVNWDHPGLRYLTTKTSC